MGGVEGGGLQEAIASFFSIFLQHLSSASLSCSLPPVNVGGWTAVNVGGWAAEGALLNVPRPQPSRAAANHRLPSTNLQRQLIVHHAEVGHAAVVVQRRAALRGITHRGT